MEAAYASTADVQQDEFARKPCERKGRTDGRDLEGEIKGVFIKCESGHSSPGSPTPGQPDSTWPAARGLPSAFSSWPPSLLIPPFLSPPSLCTSFVSFALLVHRFFFLSVCSAPVISVLLRLLSPLPSLFLSIPSFCKSLQFSPFHFNIFSFRPALRFSSPPFSNLCLLISCLSLSASHSSFDLSFSLSHVLLLSSCFCDLFLLHLFLFPLLHFFLLSLFLLSSNVFFCYILYIPSLSVIISFFLFCFPLSPSFCGLF